MSLYPPGCSGPPDYAEDCQVCGAYDTDHCVCPECLVCGTAGDPKCYQSKDTQWGHGMLLSKKQVDMFKARMDAEAEQARGEAEWLAKHNQEVEHYYSQLEKELNDEIY